MPANEPSKQVRFLFTMIIKYQSDYNSIKRFPDIEINDFSIFTGKNGSGKTHILNAIKLGNIIVDDINPNEILYLDYSGFAYNFQTTTTTETSSKISAWNRLNNQNGNDIMFQLKNTENVIASYKDFIEKIAETKDKPIFELTIDDLSGVENKVAFDTLSQYKAQISNIFDNQNYVNDDIAYSLYDSVVVKSKKFLSTLKQYEFVSLYQKGAIGGRKILSDLSNIFLDYYKKRSRNVWAKAEGKKSLDDKEFILINGLPPWELVRSILDSFDLGFKINDPSEEDTDPYDGSFQIKFKNVRRGNTNVPWEALSSGEQILITLVNAIYTSNKKGKLPKLLLLDEIDGPLNPSILRKFIEYIENSFVQKGIKTIIATHSPSTVALAPDNSIYAINTLSEIPINNVDVNKAIRLLSEGFITLADLLQLEKITASKIIISEGRNYNYIERAKQYCYSKEDLDILRIKSMGSNNLRVLFDFIRIFNKQKEFIFVWDYDYRFDNNEGKARDLGKIKNSSDKNNRVFIFERNSKGKILDGIENLFCEDNIASYEGNIENGKLTNKARFQKYILSRNKKADFKNFEKLFIFINSRNTSNI